MTLAPSAGNNGEHASWGADVADADASLSDAVKLPRLIQFYPGQFSATCLSSSHVRNVEVSSCSLSKCSRRALQGWVPLWNSSNRVMLRETHMGDLSTKRGFIPPPDPLGLLSNTFRSLSPFDTRTTQ